MTEETPTDTMSVATELQEHIEVVEDLARRVEALDVPESAKNVTARFTRDCRVLIADCKAAENPTTEDLVDLKDYRDMLEVRHHNLTEKASADISRDDD